MGDQPVNPLVVPARGAALPPAIGPNLGLVPVAIVDAGEDVLRRFIEFFVAEIRNRNTRAAYASAVIRFFDWCEAREIDFARIDTMTVAVYVEGLGEGLAPSTVKQHLAAIRRLFDYLLVVGVGPKINPATAVRGPRIRQTEGKTPILYEDDARAFLAAFGDDLVSLRDAALVSVMLYSFGRVSAVVGMDLRDFRESVEGAEFVLREKGGKDRVIPAHHRAAERVQRYIDAAGLTDPRAPLFQSVRGRTGVLTGKRLLRGGAWEMVKRRAKAFGFPAVLTNHSFRGSGITEFLDKGGRLEVAGDVAGHASLQTTRAYDRRKEKMRRSELEQRISI